MVNESNNIVAYNNIPYAMLRKELPNNKDITVELEEISSYYNIFEKGEKFDPEGTKGDYIPANLRYKMSASLIKKEARFMFAETPVIKINTKGNLGQETEEEKDAITIIQDLVDTVLTESMFDDKLLKAAKDCFIGKRVACVVNFNEDDGITLDFVSSLNFIYETSYSNKNKITKFVYFTIIDDNSNLSERRIYKKVYELKNNICYFEEGLYDGRGVLIEQINEMQPTLLSRIPAVVIINDGLSNDSKGVSEVELLKDHESWFSKLNNGDIDSQRKSMNPIKYSVDMEPNTTKTLPTSAGSYWDLQSNQNIDNAHPSVGVLEPNMSYSDPLKETLARIKASAYNELDMPDVSLETLNGIITSGKALKAVYWPLVVRCKEKFKMWSPKLKYIIDILIEGAFAYSDISERYISNDLIEVEYKIDIELKNPLPEDEQEEKEMDLSEVAQQTMSRKSYMKKWRQLTDDDCDQELEQIALEKEMLEGSYGMLENNNQEEDIEEQEMNDNNFNSDDTEIKQEDNQEESNEINNEDNANA